MSRKVNGEWTHTMCVARELAKLGDEFNECFAGCSVLPVTHIRSFTQWTSVRRRRNNIGTEERQL
ncbi:unnamed protein product, partial [Dicrocoelium dendriticum]